MKITERIFRIIVLLRYPVVILSLLLFFFFGYHMNFIGSEPSASIDSVLSDDDAERIRNREVRRLFCLDEGGEEFYIAFDTDSVYSPRFLQFMAAVSEKAEQIEGVASVTDIFTAYSITGSSDGDIMIEPFMQRDDAEDMEDSKVIANARKKIEDDPFASQRLVDSRGKAAVIAVQLEDGLDDARKREAVNRVSNMAGKEILQLKKEGVNASVYSVGDTIVQRAIAQVQAGEGFIYPLMVSVLAVVMFLVFRSFSGTLIPVLIMMISVTTTIGIKALAGSRMSTIDPMLYALITTISVADSVHIVSAWYNEKTLPQFIGRARIVPVLVHSLAPCFLTSLTTAIGFAAIAVTRIPQTRSFGIIAAAGVMIGFLWTFLLCSPLLYVLYPLSMKISFRRLSAMAGKIIPSKTGISEMLSGFIATNTAAINIVFSVVFILSFVFALRIKTGTDPYSFLHNTHPVNRALSFLESNFTGLQSMDLVLESNAPGFFKTAQNLKGVDGLIEKIDGIDGVTRTDSLLKLLKQMNRAMYGGDKSRYAVPSDDSQIAQYLLFYEMSDDALTLARWAADEYSSLRIRIDIAHGADIAGVKRNIESAAQDLADVQQLKFSVTGSAVLWNRIDRLFIRGQISSLFLSLAVILGILFGVFASFRLGICSMLVNVFPVLFGLGFMGAAGIELSMGTVMISSIAIGIAVDDTIHFVFRYKRAPRSDSFTEKLKAVNTSVLRPIVFTSVVLSIGFFSNTLSSFKPNAYFGLISGIVIIAAALADIFWLPSLIALFGKNK